MFAKQISNQLILGIDKNIFVLPPLPQAFKGIANFEKESFPHQVLMNIGIASIYEETGFLPNFKMAENLTEAPEESLAFYKDENGFLSSLLKSDAPILFQILFDAIFQKGLLCTPTLLPKILNIGIKEKTLQGQIALISGERGKWLAKQNAAWEYVLNNSLTMEQEIWEMGTEEQRASYFKRLRKDDPQKAREILKNEFNTLSAKERETLLNVFALNLSGQDEEFITQALTDRSKEVRNIAKRLLVSLPESAYRNKIIKIAQEYVVIEKSFLRSKLSIEAPEVFKEEWKLLGLEKVSSNKSIKMGERAGWLYQILSLLPLEWWTEYNQMSAEDILKWVRKSDWKQPALLAIGEVITQQKNTQWLYSVLNENLSKETNIDALDIVGQLPLKDKLHYWERETYLRSTKVDDGFFSTALINLKQQFKYNEISKEIFFYVLNEMKSRVEKNADYLYYIKNDLPGFICLGFNFLEETKDFMTHLKIENSKYQETIIDTFQTLEYLQYIKFFLNEEKS